MVRLNECHLFIIKYLNNFNDLVKCYLYLKFKNIINFVLIKNFSFYSYFSKLISFIVIIHKDINSISSYCLNSLFYSECSYSIQFNSSSKFILLSSCTNMIFTWFISWSSLASPFSITACSSTISINNKFLFHYLL